MMLPDAFSSFAPLAAVKSVQAPEPSWIESSPEMLALAAFAALLLIVLHVFSR